MDDDSRNMRVPDCVRGIGTRSIRCRDGNISFYYDDHVAVTMTALNIGYMEHQVQRNLFAVRVNVSPITQVSHIVAAMDPLLDPLATAIPFDDVTFATGLLDPAQVADRPTHVLRRFPECVVLVASETTSDLLMEGLAEAEIFGVNCNPVRIGPRYTQPQIRLLGYPPIPFGHRVENPDDLVMMLRECCPLHCQEQLARIMENPSFCTEMILQMIYDAMFPEEPDAELY